MNIHDLIKKVTADVDIHQPDLANPPQNVVYFLCDESGAILYIGKSANYGLHKRHIYHTRRFDFKEMYAISLGGSKDCYPLEQGLISLLGPPINKSCNCDLSYVKFAIKYLGLNHPEEILKQNDKSRIIIKSTGGLVEVDHRYKKKNRVKGFYSAGLLAALYFNQFNPGQYNIDSANDCRRAGNNWNDRIRNNRLIDLSKLSLAIEIYKEKMERAILEQLKNPLEVTNNSKPD